MRTRHSAFASPLLRARAGRSAQRALHAGEPSDALVNRPARCGSPAALKTPQAAPVVQQHISKQPAPPQPASMGTITLHPAADATSDLPCTTEGFFLPAPRFASPYMIEDVTATSPSNTAQRIAAIVYSKAAKRSKTSPEPRLITRTLGRERGAPQQDTEALETLSAPLLPGSSVASAVGASPELHIAEGAVQAAGIPPSRHAATCPGSIAAESTSVCRATVSAHAEGSGSRVATAAQWPNPSAAGGTAGSIPCAEPTPLAAVAASAAVAVAGRLHGAAQNEGEPDDAWHARGMECVGGGAASGRRPGLQPECRAQRRVRFADGPLKAVHGTLDGHPAHEGCQGALRVRGVANAWGETLKQSHVRDLERELGPENAPSVERLKRRVGLLPPIRRPRTFVTVHPGKPSDAAAEVLQSPSTLTLLERLLGGVLSARRAWVTAAPASAPAPRRALLAASRPATAVLALRRDTSVSPKRSVVRPAVGSTSGLVLEEQEHAEYQARREAPAAIKTSESLRGRNPADPWLQIDSSVPDADSMQRSAARNEPAAKRQRRQQSRPLEEEQSRAKAVSSRAPPWQPAMLAAAKAGNSRIAGSPMVIDDPLKGNGATSLLGLGPGRRARSGKDAGNGGMGSSPRSRRIGSLSNGRF